MPREGRDRPDACRRPRMPLVAPRRFVAPLVLACVALVSALGVAIADYQFDARPEASVWIRGKRTLGDAMTASLRRPLGDAAELLRRNLGGGPRVAPAHLHHEQDSRDKQVLSKI